MTRGVGIKICGLTEEAGVTACLTHRVDWVGFVFFRDSPRFVLPTRAAELARPVLAAVERPALVGLFVEPSDADIAAALEAVPLDTLQLYTAPHRALSLRERFGVETWVSYPVSAKADLPSASAFDRLVIESRPPEGTSRPGGNGIAFPWHLTRDWHAPCPWMLAGGLRADTVARAITESGASAVDVSSGVESAPGVKDPQAIAHFVEAVRASYGKDRAFPLESREDAGI